MRTMLMYAIKCLVRFADRFIFAHSSIRVTAEVAKHALRARLCQVDCYFDHLLPDRGCTGARFAFFKLKHELTAVIIGKGERDGAIVLFLDKDVEHNGVR